MRFSCSVGKLLLVAFFCGRVLISKQNLIKSCFMFPAVTLGNYMMELTAAKQSVFTLRFLETKSETKQDVDKYIGLLNLLLTKFLFKIPD